MTAKWDRRYLRLAEEVASWSKDPSSQVGCVIMDAEHRRSSFGFNGFPVGVEDTEERLNDRDTKHDYVVHAELNAIIQAGHDMRGGTAYITMPPCHRCAGPLIQAGITAVVTYPFEGDRAERYCRSFEIACRMFAERGVQFRFVEKA